MLVQPAAATDPSGGRDEPDPGRGVSEGSPKRGELCWMRECEKMDKDAGRNRPPDADTVRAQLLHLANLIRRLEEEGALLRAIPLLLRRLGDLRRVLFDYEVRVTERLLPIEDPLERESRKIVREARSREQELAEEWGRSFEVDRRDEEAEGSI